MPPEHVIEQATTDEALQEAIALRIAVFVDEQKFPLEVEVDQHDEVASGRTGHIVVRLVPARTVVGTIRVRHTGAYFKIERLCVRADMRACGFGAALVSAAHAWILSPHNPASVPNTNNNNNNNNVRALEAVLHAQIPVVPFYKRFGYIEEGDTFDEDGEPHQKMRKRFLQDD